MIDFKKLKEGDLIYWKPKDTPKTKKGKRSCVCGIYAGIIEASQKIIIADCYVLSTEAPYAGGVTFLEKGTKFEIPSYGIKCKYWKIRKANKDTMIYEQQSQGLGDDDED